MIKKTVLLLLSLFAFCTVSAAEQNTGQLNDFIRHCVENSEFDPENPNMKGMNFYREFTGKYKVVYANKKFFSYHSDELNYTGGANGHHMVKVGSLRRGSGKKITFKEIAPSKEHCQKLLALITSGIAKHFKCSEKELSGKLLAKPFLTENFYLNDTGIMFIFNEYEIACKGAGVIYAFVPYSKYKINLK